MSKSNSTSQYLVVVDRNGAKVYRSEGVGSEGETLTAHGTHHHGRGDRTSAEGNDGKTHAETKAFADEVAKSLHAADQILFLGSGTGNSSAAHQLLAELKHHHPAVAAKVVGEVHADATHMSEGQLLAKAREFFAAHAG